MHRRVAALAVPLTAIALVVSSCGSIPEEWRTPAFLRMDDDEIDSRLPDVSGDIGEEPEVTFPDHEPPDEAISGIVRRGADEDPLVRADDLVVANSVLYQWTGPGEGEQAEGQSTYENGAPDLLPMEQVGDEISETLVNQPVNTRAVYSSPPATEEEREQAEMQGQPVPEGGRVMVVDLIDRFSAGQTVPGEQTEDGGGDLPTVTQDGHSQPEIDIPDTEPPSELTVEPLIEGEDDEVEDGQRVVLQYTAMLWAPEEEEGEHRAFDSTWDRGGAPTNVTVGAAEFIDGSEAWDEAMVGQNVGSRLLMVVPPDQMGYTEEEAEQLSTEEGTLVFVLDVLGAVDSPPPPDPEDMEGMNPEDLEGMNPEDLEGMNPEDLEGMVPEEMPEDGE